MTHEWDPNVIFADPPAPCRIYGDDKGALFSLVDEIDYAWALQWKWSPKWSKGGRKVYLRRNVQVSIADFGTCPETGVRLRDRTQRTLFLHTAIIERMGLEPPSPEHVLVDHRDGDGMNCCRANLRWATHSMNARNVRGKFAHVLGDW